MRKSLFSPLFLVGGLLLMLGGCDLLGDDEKCQYESVDSKVWTPEADVAYAAQDTSVSFVYSREGDVYNRSFHFNNVCPLGAMLVTVNIREKGSILAPRPRAYWVLLVERLPQTYKYRVRRLFPAYRLSDNQLKAEKEYLLVGLPEEGPRDFFIGVAATFDEGAFPSRFDLETWAHDNVAQIDMIVNYVKYE